MPSDSSREPYLEPYRRSHQRHGSAFEVTLWASPRSQRLRFEVFTEMTFLAGKTILDAGCSRGDLAEFLLERDIPFKSYLGIDALCEVIDFAKERHLARCDFRCGDFVAKPELLASAKCDVVCISGTLNTMKDDEVSSVLEAAWAAAGQTLMFNFLSDRASAAAPPQDGFARRLSVTKLIEWATTRTPYIAFRQDYFREGHDATIMMRRPV